MKDTISTQLFIQLQKVVPQHLLSRCAGAFAASEVSIIKKTFINNFAKHYNVNMQEALNPDLDSYKSFNDFFTRALKPYARPIDNNLENICCPADGAISEIGDIKNNTLLQAKGRKYSSTALLGGRADLAKQFSNGKFATVYLSPRDYHRVHMPLKGTLKETIYVPGDLFSVNNNTAANVNNLFARNERLVCIFETELGPMAYIMVGAMIVAGIETVFSGKVCPVKKQTRETNYSSKPKSVTLEKGDELGRFFLGSTVIMLFPENSIEWNSGLQHQTPVLMGEAMASIKTQAE